MNELYRAFEDYLNLYLQQNEGIVPWINGDITQNNVKVILNMINNNKRWYVEQINILGQEKSLSEDELVSIKQLQLKNKELKEIIKTRTNELKDAIKSIKSISETDYLTGLYNRKKFYSISEEEKEKTTLQNRELSVILCDIDCFKMINDKHGREVGDEILRIASGILRNTLRRNDIFARWNGDKFIVLLPDTDIKTGVKIAEKLRIFINNSQNKYNAPIIMSFGVTEYVKGENMDSIIDKVELALKKAKLNGKNRVEVVL